MVLRIYGHSVYSKVAGGRAHRQQRRSSRDNGLYFDWCPVLQVRGSSSCESTDWSGETAMEGAWGGNREKRNNQTTITPSSARGWNVVCGSRLFWHSGKGIHRQRLAVGHLAPLQSLRKRRTEMRALAALRRGSVTRVHNGAPPPTFPLFLPPLPSRVVTSACEFTSRLQQDVPVCFRAKIQVAGHDLGAGSCLVSASRLTNGVWTGFSCLQVNRVEEQIGRAHASHNVIRT